MKNSIYLSLALMLFFSTSACNQKPDATTKTIQASTDKNIEVKPNIPPPDELSKALFYAIQEDNIWNFSELLPSIYDYEALAKKKTKSPEAEKQVMINLNENYHQFSAARKRSFFNTRSKGKEAGINWKECVFSHYQLLKDESGSGPDRLRIFFKQAEKEYWLETEECSTLGGKVWYLLGDLNLQGEKSQATPDVYAVLQEYGADASEQYKAKSIQASALNDQTRASNLMDQKNSSAWVSLAQTRSVIEFNYKPQKDFPLSTVSIFNGTKSYAGVQKMKLSFNGKAVANIHLKNTKALQQVWFPDLFLKKDKEAKITLEVLAGYGNSDASVAIRDLYFSPH